MGGGSVIPKADARRVAEAEHEAAAKALEQRIDGAIRTQYGSGYVYVDIDNVSRIVVDAVVKQYEAGGWNVKRHDDQRDGSTLALD
jgi:hypothetical protein